jgi:excisionase family DNA binding protein
MIKEPNPSALPESGLATRKMVAEYLGVTVRTVDKMVGDGRLKKINGLGAKVSRFDVSHLRQVLSS